MLLEIISPEATIKMDNVESIYSRNDLGVFGILEHHVPFISTLTDRVQLRVSLVDGSFRTFQLTDALLRVERSKEGSRKVTVIAGGIESEDSSIKGL